MKIVSWNCQQGFINKEKYKKLLELEPDLAVVQECCHPKMFDKKFLYLDVIWRGNIEQKGLCVISFSEDLNFSVLETKYEWILPIKVTGKRNFLLVAVWVIKQPDRSYGEYIFSTLKGYKDLFENEEVVIIGDFNFDQKLPASYRGTKGIKEISEFLVSYQIYSCYHTFTGEDYGKESKPTHYYHRKTYNPFHIDYCFASEKLLKSITNFSIGEEEWINWSDHVPLILETSM